MHIKMKDKYIFELQNFVIKKLWIKNSDGKYIQLLLLEEKLH